MTIEAHRRVRILNGRIGEVVVVVDAVVIVGVLPAAHRRVYPRW
jgi:hypothetical protein